MPVPATINDIFTTAGSNPPGGGETPAEGDNHIRAAYSFIATLRDILNGASATTAAIQTLVVSGTSVFTGAATFNGNVTANANTVIGSDSSDTLTVNATTSLVGYADTPNTAAFSAYRSSAQSLPISTVTTCIFPTESVDRAGGYNNSTGVFTAPRTGLYQVNAVLGIQNNAVGTATFNGAYISKNDAVTAGNAVFLSGATARGGSISPASNASDYSGGAVLSLTSGDTLRVKVDVGAGAILTLTSFSTFSVTYLG